MSHDAAAPGPEETLVALVRDAGRDVLASLAREVGDLALAEDAVQDAVLRALDRWPVDGVPDRPAAWLRVVARNRARDLVRAESRREAREERAHREDLVTGRHSAAPAHDQEDPMSSSYPGHFPEGPDEIPPEVLHDDLLRLLFTCCHPSLAPASQVALALRTLCGLSEEEIARALLSTPDAVAKRLVRTRQKIRAAGIPYKVPSEAELPQRWGAVLTTVYLLLNEGYSATAGPDLVRPALLEQALRLAGLLHALRPDDVGACGLLALGLLQDSRRAERLDDDGVPKLLADQDRSRWDRAAIRAGSELVTAGLRLSTAGAPVDRYLAQAAIAACHALAPDYAGTDWDAIVSWYDALLVTDPSPVVALNRAVALAERDGAEAGLTAVLAVPGLERYPLWHATQAVLLRRLGREEEAARADARAAALPLPEPTRRLLDPAG